MRVKILNELGAKKRGLGDTADDAANTNLSASRVEQQQEAVVKPVTLKRVRIEVPKISSNQPTASASSAAGGSRAPYATLFNVDDVFSHAASATTTETSAVSAAATTVSSSGTTSIAGDDDSLSQHSSGINTSISTDATGEISQPSVSNVPETAVVEQYVEPDVVLPPVNSPQHGFFRLLAYYIRWLQRQDKKQLFHHPVTEALAPGYRNVIQTPMDFETMSVKLHAGNYTYIAQFMADFHLLCWNAMKYNKPSTNIYRAAKMLLASGKRAFTYEKIETLKRSKQFIYIHNIERGRLNFHRYDLSTKRPYAPQLPGIGLSDNSEASDSTSRPQQPNQVAKPFEAFPDNLTPEEILQQVRQKARQAAQNVRKQAVQVKFGFVESMEAPAGGGANDEPLVTLRIVNPGASTSAERFEQIPLGVLAGRVPASYGENGFDQQSQTAFFNTSPVTAFTRHFPQPSQAAHDALFSTFYADYNAYSSALPYFDRRESVFTREDLTDLRAAYKTDRGLQYGEAMMRFARNTHPRVRTVIEKHLQKMTEKSTMRHATLVSMLGTRLAQRRENVDAEIRLRATATVKCDRLLDARLSPGEKLLEHFGTAAGVAAVGNNVNAGDTTSSSSQTVDKADLDFIDGLLRESDDDAQQQLLSDADVQKALDLNAEVLFALYMQQTARMTEQYETLRAVPFSTEMERELAELSVGLFKRLVRRASPEDVVSVQALRRAMGLPGVDETQHLSAESLIRLVQAPTTNSVIPALSTSTI